MLLARNSECAGDTRNRNAHGLQLILRRMVKNRNLPPNLGACLPSPKSWCLFLGLPRNVFHNLRAHDLLRRHRCLPRLGTEGGSPGSARTPAFRARAAPYRRSGDRSRGPVCGPRPTATRGPGLRHPPRVTVGPRASAGPRGPRSNSRRPGRRELREAAVPARRCKSPVALTVWG